MTQQYKNVYVGGTSTVTGPYEAKGPLHKYFDKSYEDLYNGESSFELAEVKLLTDSLDILMKKTRLKKDQIELVVAGDLLNQITASCYAVEKLSVPFLGVYSACATSAESIIIASQYIENGQIKRAVCATSSHNMGSEKQFRNPTEYGAPKPMTSTFTATGGASILLTSEKTNIRIESTTIGCVQDMNQKDPLHMGSVMAPAAADTIHKHLTDLGRDASYYDLILTGDLGIYGKEILIDYMKNEYGIDISPNYNDCGVMLYDLESQKDVHAGGSGPVCSALVNYGYIMEQLKKGVLKRVLIVPTGALFSPTFAYQKQPILSISHAVSLEAVL